MEKCRVRGPGRIALAVLASFLLASPSSALTLDWTTIGWDPNDTSGSQDFSDVDGSGVDMTVSYTTTMFWNDGVPLLYTNASAPTQEIAGSLKFTNKLHEVFAPTTVTLTFSEDIFINQATLFSHSIVANNFQEHSLVVARSLAGTAIAASLYDTTTPGLVALDGDGDEEYESVGLGYQNNDEYGTVVYGYQDTAVRSISFSLWIFEEGTDDFIRGYASMGIGAVDFTPSNPVPEPGSALLASLGLVGIAVQATRHRKRHG